MARKLILILEDNAERVAAMTEWLSDRFEMYDYAFTDDPREIVRQVNANFDRLLVLSLDHDLFERIDQTVDRTGMDVVDALVEMTPHFPVLVHSSNTMAAEKMQRRLRRGKWTVQRVSPFNDTEWIGLDWYPTLRRMINRQAKTATVNKAELVDILGPQ